MEEIIERPDGTFAIAVDEGSGTITSIVDDDGEGFKTARAARARLKRIRQVICNPFRPDISLCRRA